MIRPRFTLGGTLSIVNCFFWVCIAAGARELPEWAFMVLMPLMVFLALPIAIPFLMPGGFFGSSAQGVVLDAVLVGINSLLWGHGLAWILRTVGRRFGWIPRAQDDPLRSNRPESREPRAESREPRVLSPESSLLISSSKNGMRIPVLIRCDGTGPGRSDDGNAVDPVQPETGRSVPEGGRIRYSGGRSNGASRAEGGTIYSPGKDRHEVRPVQSGLIEFGVGSSRDDRRLSRSEPDPTFAKGAPPMQAENRHRATIRRFV